MSLHFRGIEEFIPGNLLPKFDVCSGDSEVFKLLRMQYRGIIEAGDQDGPKVVGEDQDLLFISAVKCAILTEAHVFLTPEYSFPVKLISKIVSNPDTQPISGKLWCLACQGESVRNFREYLNEWEAQGAYVVRDSLEGEGVYISNFIGAIIYVFKLKNNQICVVPQLKTECMADPLLLCEGAGLSKGNLVYVFGHGYPNHLCSIICADSMNRYLNPQSLFPVGNEHVILLHPQFNPKPRNSSFSGFRRKIFDQASGDRLVYITANWAYDSEAVDPSGNIRIKNPWSVIYVKNKIEGLSDGLRNTIKKNFSLGISYAKWKAFKVDMWYSSKLENLQLIFIKKPSNNGASIIQPGQNVLTKECWIASADRSGWISRGVGFNLQIPVTIPPNRSRFSYPENSCIYKRDRFFGLCFGHFEEGQYYANENEICNRLGIHIDDECELERRHASRSFNWLVQCLSELGVPLVYRFGDTFEFGLSDTYQAFNLFPASKVEKKGLLVIFLEDECELKMFNYNLSKKLHITDYLRTCVYTLSSVDFKPKVYRLQIDGNIYSPQRKKDRVSIIRG